MTVRRHRVIRFRPAGHPLEPPAALATVTQVAQLIGDVFLPAHFLAADLPLTWSGPQSEEISWEIFRGRLLDPAQTRERRAFTAWNLYGACAEPTNTARHQADAGRISNPSGHTSGATDWKSVLQEPAEPLLSVKLDEQRGEIHVVRGVLCHVWEGHGERVIESREVV